MAAKKKKGKPLPPALARNATALAKGKQKRMRARGVELIALVQQKQQDVGSLFYEMGQFLRELSSQAIYTALGYSSFQALVEENFDMKLGHATQLKLVPQKMGQKLAIDLGVTKSIAVASALEVPGISLQGTTLRFEAPRFNESAPILKTTTKQIEELTKLVRHKIQGDSKPRGLSTTPQERSHAEALQKALHHSGAEKASVKCVATKRGQPADFIIRVNSEALSTLQKTLVSLARSSSRS